jgi:hypothetical protein
MWRQDHLCYASIQGYDYGHASCFVYYALAPERKDLMLALLLVRTLLHESVTSDHSELVSQSVEMSVHVLDLPLRSELLGLSFCGWGHSPCQNDELTVDCPCRAFCKMLRQSSTLPSRNKLSGSSKAPRFFAESNIG